MLTGQFERMPFLNFTFGMLLYSCFLHVHRLEEKMYEMESEGQILRQQSLLSTPVTRSSGLPPTPPTKVNTMV